MSGTRYAFEAGGKPAAMANRLDECLRELHKPIKDWSFMKLIIGIPLERALSHAPEVLPSIANLGQRGARFVWHPYGRIDVVRNRMVATMLTSPERFTHILFLDSDHVHPPDIVERLAMWFYLYKDVEVVSGHNFQRFPPYKACWYMQNGAGELEIPTQWDRGLVEAASIGGGSLMVSRKVFEKIRPVWFQFMYDEALNDVYPGEDTYFSLLCRENGVKLWVDTTTTSPHITTINITEETYNDWYGRYGLRTEEQAVKDVLDNRERKESRKRSK